MEAFSALAEKGVVIIFVEQRYAGRSVLALDVEASGQVRLAVLATEIR